MYQHQETTFTVPKLTKKLHYWISQAGVVLDPWKPYHRGNPAIFSEISPEKAAHISAYLRARGIRHSRNTFEVYR